MKSRWASTGMRGGKGLAAPLPHTASPRRLPARRAKGAPTVPL